MKSKLGTLRLIHVAYIISVPLFVYLGENLRGRDSNDWTGWHWLVAGFAVYSGLVGYFFGRRLIHRSEEDLAKDTSDPKAFKNWINGDIISFASAEAFVACGVVLRIVLGGAFWQASLLYAVGLILLLLWTPRMPKNIAVAL